MANGAVKIPFGMTTASASRWSTIVRRACSDTAMRAVILSSAVCRIDEAANQARDLGFAAWKVATTGTVLAQHASSPRLGLAGSCTCRTSNCPSRTQRRTRPATRGPNASRATEPL